MATAAVAPLDHGVGARSGDTEPAGSTQFAVMYDVSKVPGATNALIEFSAPTIDFAKALFFTGNFGPTNTFVNNFTNPNGDRLDAGDNFGIAGNGSVLSYADFSRAACRT